MHNYKELKMWNVAIELATKVYQIIKIFPKEEKYGIVDQIKRSSISVSANIAEGSGRKTDKEFSYFLSISNGSCCELETLLIVSHKIKMIDEEILEELSQEIQSIQKMIKSFQYKLNTNP